MNILKTLQSIENNELLKTFKELIQMIWYNIIN